MAKPKGSALTMQVKIWAPFKVYFDGVANSLTAANETGPFDILPHHQNFITLLQPGDLIVRRAGTKDYRLTISRAVMHVKADRVSVFLDV